MQAGTPTDSVRRVVVLGGAQGIGLATALAARARGARVAVLDRDEDALAEAAHALPGAFLARGDVTSAGDLEAFAAEAEARLDGVDTVVDSAGTAAFGGLETMALTAIDRAIDVNVRGAVLACRAFVPALRRAGGGTLVLVASNAGLVARPEDPVYCATKAAVVMLARSLALSLAADRIRVNAVCPGPVDTPMLRAHWNGTPSEDALRRVLASVPLGRALGRVADPAEVAEAILFLSSDAAAYTTGVALPVDGGKTAGLQVVPAAADPPGEGSR